MTQWQFETLPFELEGEDFLGEGAFMFEAYEHEAEFETAPGPSSYALLRAIPDRADYKSVVPLDYRLNAKAIVGNLAQDLQKLKDPSASQLGKMAMGIFKVASGANPVTLMSRILIGALKNIPGGYLAAGAKIAADEAANGFSHGVLAGALERSTAEVRDMFGNRSFARNKHLPSGRAIAIANYQAGLLAGYAQGRALSKNQRDIFWHDLSARAGDQTYRGHSSRWTRKQWSDWYMDIGGVFRRYHLV